MLYSFSRYFIVIRLCLRSKLALVTYEIYTCNILDKKGLLRANNIIYVIRIFFTVPFVFEKLVEFTMFIKPMYTTRTNN